MKDSTGTLNDGLNGTLREAIGLWPMRRARIVPPSQLAASLDELAGVARVHVLHVVIGRDELWEGGLRCLGVLVDGWACHDGAGVLVEYNQGVFVPMSTRSVVLGKDDVVGGEGVCISSWGECLVCCVVRCGLRRSVAVVASAARCVLCHGPRADLTVRVLWRVSQVV